MTTEQHVEKVLQSMDAMKADFIALFDRHKETIAALADPTKSGEVAMGIGVCFGHAFGRWFANQNSVPKDVRPALMKAVMVEAVTHAVLAASVDGEQ